MQLDSDLPKKIQPIEHIVLVFCNGIGDAFMALPALRALRRVFTKKITLICCQSHENWWYDELHFDEVLPFDFDVSNQRINFEVNYAYKQIKHVDIVISLLTDKSESLEQLIELWKPKWTAGMFGSHDFVLKCYKDLNMFCACFELMKLIDSSIVITDFAYPIIIPKPALHTAKLFLNHIIRNNTKILCIHMETKPEKMWSKNSWQQLLNQVLVTLPNYKILIIGLKEDSSIDKDDKNIISFFGFNLALIAAMLTCADIFIGVDSCMLHLADLAKIPSIGLFGPTDPKRFGCYFTNGRNIHSANKMMDMKVADVLQELALLSDSFQRKNYETTY